MALGLSVTSAHSLGVFVPCSFLNYIFVCCSILWRHCI